MVGEKKVVRRQKANDNMKFIDALNENTAALKAQKLALDSHAAVLTAHAIALTPGDARGACTIVFADERSDYCENNKTNRECQELAAEMQGIARPIVAGQRCFRG